MTQPTPLSPFEPLPALSSWLQTLRQVAAGPLAFCEDFPTIARRFEAWWAHDLLDRPIFIGAVNANPDRPFSKRLHLLDRPDAWLQEKVADMHQTYRVGDALPHIRVDFGPVMLGGLFGAGVEFRSDTAWTHPFINDDWSNAPDWNLRDDNDWWMLLRRLTGRVAEDAAGRYLVCTPDLGGSGDVLLNLRGSAKLCLDVRLQADRVQSAIEAIYPAWRQAFSELYGIVMERGAGLVHWLGLWSSQPYMIPACDFNSMIAPKDFQRLFLPDIAHQAATVGRAVFHLDGPDAAVHIEALLDVPEVQAIQFTPGAGTPSAMVWVEMFRRIQQRGRSLLVVCPADEVLALSDALRPEGLAILLDAESLSPKHLDDLFARFQQRYSDR